MNISILKLRENSKFDVFCKVMGKVYYIKIEENR